MSLPPLLYKGSVKNVLGVLGSETFFFNFSDRYSVFDWGEMPDTLEGKGVALNCIADIFFSVLGDPEFWKNLELTSDELDSLSDPNNFEYLKEFGLPHHCQGMVNEEGKKIEDDSVSSLLAVSPIQVLNPQVLEGPNDYGDLYDYQVYQDKPLNTLVPLEVVFRFGVPEGSSLVKRLSSDPHYSEELGLRSLPREGDLFGSPLIEFSTKLEPSDRYIDYKTAKRLAGLTDGEFDRLNDLAKLSSMAVYSIFSEIELELWDGKFEFAFSGERDEKGDRYFKLVDSIGPDELRVLSSCGQLSKEFLRQFYTNGTWHNAIQLAKEAARNMGESNWKKICIEEFKSTPDRLSQAYLEAASNIYRTMANLLCEKFGRGTPFPNAPDLSSLLEQLDRATEERL